MIRKEKGGWSVFSHKTGKRLGGPYPSKAQAHKRLGEIKHFKGKK